MDSIGFVFPIQILLMDNYSDWTEGCCEMIDQKISESFGLVFVAIDLFVEVDDVGFGVGEEAGVVFPDVAVVLVVLVVVDVFCFYFLFSAFDDAEVD